MADVNTRMEELEKMMKEEGEEKDLNGISGDSKGPKKEEGKRRSKGPKRVKIEK